jgi:hypothetical protein
LIERRTQRNGKAFITILDNLNESFLKNTPDEDVVVKLHDYKGINFKGREKDSIYVLFPREYSGYHAANIDGIEGLRTELTPETITEHRLERISLLVAKLVIRNEIPLEVA